MLNSPSSYSSYQESAFHRHGYVVIPELLPSHAVHQLHELVSNQVDTLPWVRDTGGLVAPGLLEAAEYRQLLPVVEAPYRQAKLHRALKSALNSSHVVFADMAEVQVNRSCGWHRDVLHKTDVQYYRKHGDVWDPRYGMARLIMYLEPHVHRNDSGALHVFPGSHHKPVCSRDDGTASCPAARARGLPRKLDESAARYLHPRAGDAILFDMRIVHRGAFVNQSRISLQLTFGIDNGFTREWQQGDRQRRLRTANKSGVALAATPVRLDGAARGRRALNDSAPIDSDVAPSGARRLAVDAKGRSGVDQLISNRRVAIVGPAGYLAAYDVRELLTSVDTIVRPNVQVDLERSSLVLSPHTTERCDVVYHAGPSTAMPIARHDGRSVLTPAHLALGNESLAIYVQRGVRAVVVAQQSAARRRHFQQLLSAGWGERLLLEQLPKPTKSAESHFRTGVKALIDVLSRRPAALFLLGYDFYQRDGSPRGFEGYYAWFGNDTAAGDAPQHDTDRELHVLARLLQAHPELRVDQHLATRLQSAVGQRVQRTQLLPPQPLWRSAGTSASTSA